MSNDPRDPDDRDANDATAEVTDGAATELVPELSDADTTFVTGVLASAGPDSIGPVPTDVADRWMAAIEAESATRAALAAEGVVPLQRRRSSSSSRFSPTRFAGIAAGVAAVALVGGIVVNQASDGPDGVATTPIVAGPERTEAPSISPQSGDANVSADTQSLRVARAVTTSGTTYTAATLRATVLDLVAPRTLADVPPTTDLTEPSPQAAVGSGVVPDAGSAASIRSTNGFTVMTAAFTAEDPVQEPGTEPTEPPATTAPTTEAPTAEPPVAATEPPSDPQTGNPLMSQALNEFRTDEQKREACVDNLAQDPAANAVALDIGFYQGSPTILVVIALPEDPDTVDAFLIGPDCDADSADVRYFARFTLP